MSVILPGNWDNVGGSGKSMNQLGDEWWIRAYGFSNEKNAFIFEDITDPRGRLGSIEKARLNQPDPIFYLGGTFVADEDVTGGGGPTFTPERSIVVPEGAVLVFPLINALEPNAVLEPPAPENEDQARETANFFFDDPSIFTATVTVDGISETIGPVTSLPGSGLDPVENSFRRQSVSGFEYTIPEDNIFDITRAPLDFPAQTVSGAVSDGYWYAFDTSDLGPGSHTLEFDASIDVDADGNSDFTLEVTYNILNPIEGSNGKNNLNGTKGNDYIDGGDGPDKLMGLKGDDLIVRGDGADVIDGGKGNDELWGDGGLDTFIFKRNYGNDKIFDFEPGEVVEIKGFSEIPDPVDIDLPSGVSAAQIDFNGDDILTFVNVASSDLSVNLAESTITL